MIQTRNTWLTDTFSLFVVNLHSMVHEQTSTSRLMLNLNILCPFQSSGNTSDTAQYVVTSEYFFVFGEVKTFSKLDFEGFLAFETPRNCHAAPILQIWRSKLNRTAKFQIQIPIRNLTKFPAKFAKKIWHFPTPWFPAETFHWLWPWYNLQRVNIVHQPMSGSTQGGILCENTCNPGLLVRDTMARSDSDFQIENATSHVTRSASSPQTMTVII